jgi:YD repeat-containing protein
MYTSGPESENRPASVAHNDSTIATFVYDGDGNRAKATVGGATTVYIGDDKCSSGVDKTCYSLGGQRVAMTDGVLVRFDLADHLGSSTIDADGTAVKQAELRCGKERPFVEPRDLRGRPAVASGGALKEK